MNKMVSILLACAGGAAIAVQARITGALRVQVGDGALAAAITFGTGLLLMLIVTLSTRANRKSLGELFTGVVQGRIPIFLLLSGLSGAYAVYGQGITVNLLGVAVFSLTFIAGQLIASITLDLRGWVPAGRKSMTRGRTGGTIVAITGIVLAIAPRLFAEGEPRSATVIDPVIFAGILMVFSAGLLQPGQMAMNGIIGAAISRPEPVALVNYIVGTSMLLILAWPAITHGGLTRLPADWENLWLYGGGLLGSIVVIGGTLLTRTIGSLTFTLGIVAGQICCSLIIDAFWPVPGSVVNWVTVAGGTLTMLAITLASGPGTWRRRGSA